MKKKNDDIMSRSTHRSDYQVLRKILLESRKSLGLTQDDLAERLNTYRSLISRVEGGERRIDPIELIYYSEALNMKPEELFNELLKRLRKK